MQSLAVKYRPHTFEDVVEQSSTIYILKQQLETNTTKNCYLFCGGAGTGKTTCARIFANEINKGQGNPIELDAASNNSVNDVRQIIDQAQSKSLDSEYKCFIIDECHSISSAGWQAFLKLIEEPPTKSIFLFCTTDPQKIPKTILSRVQRFDFQRISFKGIVKRLQYICSQENLTNVEQSALEYIAKQADGGMRDAITLMDKCLSYSTNLTLEDALKALGTASYTSFITLTNALIKNTSIKEDRSTIIKVIENIHSSGKDLKQFISQYMDFILDVCKYSTCEDFSITKLPLTDEVKQFVESASSNIYIDTVYDLLDMLIKLDASIKYNVAPKVFIEATLLTWKGKGVKTE